MTTTDTTIKAEKPLKTQKFIVKFGKRLRKLYNAALARYSRVGNAPVLDKNDFPWTKQLEDNWETVRREAEAVLALRAAIPPLEELSPDHKRLAAGGKWQSFFLWGYGFRAPKNCERCPETAKLVEQIPGLKTAMFSIHAPGMHIPRHKGVTKGMVTCHLGLKVPKQRESVRMAVSNEMLHWDEGKTFVFDDTYPHEVWNDSDEDRVILLLQVARPLRFPGNLLAGIVLTAIRWSPFVQDARRNMDSWIRRMEEAEKSKPSGA